MSQDKESLDGGNCPCPNCLMFRALMEIRTENKSIKDMIETADRAIQQVQPMVWIGLRNLGEGRTQ